MNACADSEADIKVQPSLLRRYRSELMFTLCACFYILPFMRILALGDEGTLIVGAVRVVRGQVFGKDFFEVMGPGTFYWLALFFKLFGITFVATRACLFVTSLGTVLLMFCLSRRVCRSYLALPPILLIATYCWVYWPTISHHTDSNFFALLSVMSVCLWWEEQVSSWLFIAGALAGLTTWFMQPKGILLIAALLIWLFIEKKQRQRHVPLSALAFLAGGYCVAIGMVVFYFAWHGALADLVYANFIYPHKNYKTVNVLPYAKGILTDYWYRWNFKSGIGFTIGTILILPYLLVAALPGLLPILGILWRKSFSQPYVMLFWLCGWALWFSEIHRKDIFHLVFGSPLLIILLVYYAERLPSQVSTLVLQILTISAVSLAGYNLLFVLFTHALQTRVGTVTTFGEEKMARILEQKTHPGEEIFAYPYCPIYYFLTETTNPTRYSILLYHYNTPAQFKEALQILITHRVKYVVWYTSFQGSVISRAFPATKQMNPTPQIIEPYLESHYRQIWADEDYRLMELKNDYKDSGTASALPETQSHRNVSGETQGP